MKKKVLITGSAGFVGSHIVEHILKNTDWDIIGIDSFRHRGDSLRVHGLDPERYQIITHDLSTPISKHMIHKIGHVDYIINNASLSDVDESIRNPRQFCENNVNIALTMLEFCREIQPEKYIHVSTDEVYGPALNKYNHKEWETHLPSNPYSGSKSAMVDLSISWWRTYNIPLVITETMNIIGERQDKTKFVPMLISKINHGDKVIIHGSENSIGSRFYLHARNQADGLLFLLKNHSPKLYHDSQDDVCKPDRFNIVGEVELNNLELALMVADIMGKSLNYDFQDFHKTRPGHDRRYALDGTKMKEYGWIPPVKFYDSLKKTIEWTLEHPEWMV